MKISFSRYLYFLIPKINSFLLIEKKKKERKKEKLKRNWLEDWVILNAPLHLQFNSVRVILHLGGWVKIKYLHLIRWEEIIFAGQDCAALVLYWIWNRVVAAQACFWVAFYRFFNMNDEVLTEGWTIIWTPLNCPSCHSLLYLAHKWCQPFTIVEGENKRFESSAISATGF